MQIRSLLLILLLVVIAAFAVLNWGAFTTPTSLWLGFMTVQAPLGIIMLCLLAFLAVLFAAWVVYFQGRVMLDTRRHAKELQAHREIAAKAEASRLAELQTLVTNEFQRLIRAQDDAQKATEARLAETEQRLVSRLDQAGNSLHASLGELDERIERRDAELAAASRAAAGLPRP